MSGTVYRRASVNTLGNIVRNRMPSRRESNVLGVLACVLILIYAYYIQFYQGLSPCPLCTCQRIVMAVLGFVFLVAAIHDSRRWGAQVYAVSLGLVAGIGVGIAGYHTWLQTLPVEEAAICLPPLDYLLTHFTLSETAQLLLYSPGQCGTVDGLFLGLSIPAWALLIFLGLGVMGAVRNWLPD
jgi:disulfide bond formation protein DsbB